MWSCRNAHELFCNFCVPAHVYLDTQTAFPLKRVTAKTYSKRHYVVHHTTALANQIQMTRNQCVSCTDQPFLTDGDEQSEHPNESHSPPPLSGLYTGGVMKVGAW